MKWEVSMPDTTRRQFTDAFKSVAVWLMRESGRLKRENETLRKERGLLKRAAAVHVVH